MMAALIADNRQLTAAISLISDYNQPYRMKTEPTIDCENMISKLEFSDLLQHDQDHPTVLA
ncbi:MAG: hypothetical protein ABW185_15200 [Sedimenticola sp.]